MMKLNRTEKGTYNLWLTLLLILNFTWWMIFIMEMFKVRASVTVVGIVLYFIATIIVTFMTFSKKQKMQRFKAIVAIMCLLVIGILLAHIIEWVFILISNFL